MIIFEVEAEDLTNLGGPMGTESTSISWNRHFQSVKSAKEFAEKEYAKVKMKGGEDIEWKEDDRGWSSQDLRFVMYHVRRIRVQK